MSYLSIINFIEAGRKSLEYKNYWSALSVALALPSMCSRILYKDDSTYYDVKKDGTRNWHDKRCYIDFCKASIKVNFDQPDSWFSDTLGENFPEVLYQLRCDIVHAGVINIYDDNKGLFLALGDTSSTDLSNYRIINVKDLCDSIFNHISTWCNNAGVNNLKDTFVFDIERDSDDRILYNQLCEKERADPLEKNFKEYNESKRNNKR